MSADGTIHDLKFKTRIDQSSWVAIRILPSSHTNPIFVVVEEKPVRASAESAKWCLAGVKNCRNQKRRFIKPDELADFEAAYDHAEQVYQQIIDDSK